MVLMSLCAEIAPELLHLFPKNLDKLVTGMVGCKYTFSFLSHSRFQNNIK